MPGDRVTTGGFVFAMLSRLSPVAALAFLTPAAIVATAHGQVQTVTPYYASVTVDKATVRCGDNDRFYKVGELATGDIVMVDGEGSSWSRISYPSNLYAFVKVEDVKVDGGNATLTTASKLKAANVTAGFQPSWKSLLDVPLAQGATLKVLEPVKEGESVVGYKVAAPESARTFVETRVLRRATDAEVAAFKTKGGVPALPAGTPSNPGTTTPAKPTTDVVPGPGSPVNAPNGNPGVVPSSTPVKPVIQDGQGVTPVVSQPVDATGENKPIAATEPKERPVSSLEALDARFKEVWKQAQVSSEVGEMLAEFQRTLDETPADQVGRRRVLQSRITALQTRLDLNNRIREQEEARAKLDSTKTELQKQMEVWERGRVYTIVGELRPSTVYDGKNLPLMYRVVSVGSTNVKTLGYLKPTKDMDLTRMLGQVVGVIGDATLDRSLKLNIISPVKVEVLRSSPTTETAAPATAATPEKTEKTTPAKTANVEEGGDTPSMDK